MTVEMNLILYNGLVRTLDPRRPTAQAVAVRGNRILAVGTERDVRFQAGPGAEGIDLRGGLVVPGLTDAHLHFLWYGLGLSRPNLDGARSLAEAVGRLVPPSTGLPEGQWLLGGGWNHEEWSVPCFPTRQDLDAVAFFLHE